MQKDLDRDKVLQFMNARIDELTKEDAFNRSLDDRCIGKDMFIDSTSKTLRMMQTTRAFLESGLAQKDENVGIVSVEIDVNKDFDGPELELAISESSGTARRILLSIYTKWVTEVGHPEWADRFK